MTRPTWPALRRRRLPLGLAWLLALAMLGSQGLGWWHQLVHGQGRGQVAAVPTTHGEAAPSWFDDHAAGSASCRLLDQLAPDLLVAASVALPEPGPWPAARGEPVVAGAALAPRHARQARAPPPAPSRSHAA